EAGHDPERADQRRHAERDAGDRDERVQRDRPLPAPGPQVAEPDEDFVRHRAHDFSGRSWGNRITSRIDAWFVKSMTRRSMPMPSPAVGGMPYSSARRKSSSK